MKEVTDGVSFLVKVHQYRSDFLLLAANDL